MIMVTVLTTTPSPACTAEFLGELDYKFAL